MSLVTHYCWEVNDGHPRLPGGIGDPRRGGWGGPPVTLGERGPWFTAEEGVPRHTPWGLTQVWLMENGQEVRVRWKGV